MLQASKETGLDKTKYMSMSKPELALKSLYNCM